MDKNTQIVLGLLRLSMGFIFLWAFWDKFLGLGFSTCRNPEINIVEYFCRDAWISGGSPTFAFLKFAVKGPFASFFQSLAGNLFVDWLFMLGLLGIGLSLLLGIFMKLSTFFGSIMLSLIYLASSLPPAHNPLIDSHIIYILVLIVLYLTNSGNYLGLGYFLGKLKFVEKNKIIK